MSRVDRQDSPRVTTGSPVARALTVVTMVLLGGLVSAGSSYGIIPDRSFGSGGVLLDRSRPVRTPHVAINPVGELTVSNGGPELRRFTADGHFDGTYGKDGYSTFVGSLGTGATSVRDLLPVRSGGVVMAASTYTNSTGSSSARSAVISALRSGLPNTEFGVDGIFGTDADALPSTTVSSMAQGYDGSIYVAGGVRGRSGGPGFGRLLLLDSHGRPRSHFGQNGTFRRSPKRSSPQDLVEFTDVAIAGNRGALVAGVFGKRIVVFRVDLHGRIRRWFGKDGSISVGFTGYPEEGRPLASPKTPKPEMVQDRFTGRTYLFYQDGGRSKILAFAADGRKIESFGPRGVRTINFRSKFGNFVAPAAAAVIGSGTLLMAGSVKGGTTHGRRGAFLSMNVKDKTSRGFLSLAPRAVGPFTDFVLDDSKIYAVGLGRSREAKNRTPSTLALSKYSMGGGNPHPLVQSPGVIGRDAGGECLMDSRVPIVDCTNSWGAGGGIGFHHVSVTVFGGALRGSPDTGVLFIHRSTFPEYSVPNGGAEVRGSGPIRITEAPLGAEGSAHVIDAKIQFESALGAVGYLDLADDTIHLSRGPQICPAGMTGKPPECVSDDNR